MILKYPENTSRPGGKQEKTASPWKRPALSSSSTVLKFSMLEFKTKFREKKKGHARAQ